MICVAYISNLNLLACLEVRQELPYNHWTLGGLCRFLTLDLDERVFFDITNVNYMIFVAYIPNLNLLACLEVCQELPHHH